MFILVLSKLSPAHAGINHVGDSLGMSANASPPLTRGLTGKCRKRHHARSLSPAYAGINR